MLNRPAYISIFLVAIILGILLVVQFRASSNYPAGVPRERTQEMTDELRQLREDNEALEKELNDLESKLAQVNTGQKQAVQALESELKKAKMAAGMITVRGPGVEVILDNPGDGDQQTRGEFFIIRDGDILKVINELRGAGAEALSINGERLVTTSEIRYAGSFINVNTKRIVPPYQILAIGDPETLKNSLSLPGGLSEYLEDLGINVKIEKHEDLTVPAFSGAMEFEVAKQG